MEIHQQFRLNGIPLDKDSLYEVAYSWIKEGKDFEIDAGDFLLDWLSPSEFIEVKTSGSTGVPKTIVLRKENMVNSALATGRYFQLRSKDKALLCLSTRHIAGKMMLVRAMVLGMWITVVEPSSNPLKDDTGHYDFAAMVPMQVQHIIENLNQIKKLIIGGAPISQKLRERLLSHKNSIFETYGMTETITHIAMKKLEKDNDYFEALPGVNLGRDDRGCLVIDAPKISNDDIVTNDLVKIRNDKSFKWMGRYDNVINSGGIKLIPEQMEEKLSSVIQHRFFVIGIPDEDLGEKMVLVVEGKEKEDMGNLFQRVKEVKDLAKFELPKEIFFVNRFLETPTGKIQRSKTLAVALKS